MKKVFLLLIIGGIIGYIMQSHLFLLNNVFHIASSQNQNVKGASTSALPKDFSLIQQELAKLSVSQIATSSPQIQTIIHLLQKMPKEQIKAVCQNVCNGIR